MHQLHEQLWGKPSFWWDESLNVGVVIRDTIAFFHYSLNVLPRFKCGTALTYTFSLSLYYQLVVVPPPRYCTGNVSFCERGFAFAYWPLQLLGVFGGIWIASQCLAERAWQTGKSLCSQRIALLVIRFTLLGSGKGVYCCFSFLLAQSRISFSCFPFLWLNMAGHCIPGLLSRVGLASHSEEQPERSRRAEYSLSLEGRRLAWGYDLFGMLSNQLLLPSPRSLSPAFWGHGLSPLPHLPA